MKLFGEVVATPKGPAPYAAVVRSDSKELIRAFADTREEGERLLSALLRNLGDSTPDPGDPDPAPN